MRKKLAVLEDDAVLSLWEVVITTQLVIRVRASDENDAKRKTLSQRLWVNDTAETRRFTECIAWGPESVDVGEVV
jgi:hypothetical protein